MTGVGDQDPYAVLGVDREATAREISRAYRKQMRRHHPDVAGEDPDPLAVRGALAEVQAAYALLRDGAARARYDAQRPPAEPAPTVHVGPPSAPPLRAGPVRWRSAG